MHYAPGMEAEADRVSLPAVSACPPVSPANHSTQHNTAQHSTTHRLQVRQWWWECQVPCWPLDHQSVLLRLGTPLILLDPHFLSVVVRPFNHFSNLVTALRCLHLSVRNNDSAVERIKDEVKTAD
jgi:hypothetical protein